jgi:hypothetical protein
LRPCGEAVHRAHRGMCGEGECGEHFPGPVGRMGQNLDAATGDRGILGDQPGTDGPLAVLRPGGLGQFCRGDRPSIGLDHDVGFEPVLLTGLGLMRIPGLGVHGGDNPVRGDLPGDPPAPVVPSESSAGSASCPATRASSAYASAALPSSVSGSTAASNARASVTSAEIARFWRPGHPKRSGLPMRV